MRKDHFIFGLEMIFLQLMDMVVGGRSMERHHSLASLPQPAWLSPPCRPHIGGLLVLLLLVPLQRQRVKT